jgi:hypothetical protein
MVCTSFQNGFRDIAGRSEREPEAPVKRKEDDQMDMESPQTMPGGRTNRSRKEETRTPGNIPERLL